MNIMKKRPQPSERRGDDLISKMKRAKISDSNNVVENKRNDTDAMAHFGNSSRLVTTASPTSVGDHKVDCGIGNRHVIPMPLTFPARPPALRASEATSPHVISPHESMMNLQDDTKGMTSVHGIARPEKRITAPTPCNNESDLVTTQGALSSTFKASAKYKQNKPSFSIYFVILCAAVLVTSKLFSSRNNAGYDTVYVPGAGFSGFWFTLGRLKSIPEPASKDFYCFSAGCLGVVAMFSNFTIGEVSEMAIDVQAKWRTGEISQFQVVSKFLDVLLQRFQDDAEVQDYNISSVESLALLSRLHIITSVPGKYYGLNHVIRIPENVDELREMLLQTTWIPIALGDDMTHKGHLDGAFTAGYHPSCEQSLNLPFIFDLYFNALNVNLSKQKLEKLWNAGLQYTM